MHGIAPDVVVEVDGWDVIKNYVSAGVGISFVPDLCLTDHDRLWTIPFKDRFPVRRYGVARRRDRLITLSARRFLRIMVGNLPEEAEMP